MSGAITNLLWKKEKRNYQIPECLSSKDKKKVAETIRNAQRDDGIPRTTQQSIPFDRMPQDGICRAGTDYHTKTIRSQDINYQLAQQEDQMEISEKWCSFLNLFDSPVHFELSFMNPTADSGKSEKSVAVAYRDDDFDEVRDKHTDMLKRQMGAGNNGLTKTKYLTFGIHAESMEITKPRFTHIEMNLLNNFKRPGVQAETSDGRGRLELIYQELHMEDDQKFFFDWKWLMPSGLSIKDFIAPSSLNFKDGRAFQMGELWCAMSLLSITASDINDRMPADSPPMESTQIIIMHIQSVDQTEAIKAVKHAVIELDRPEIEEQKKAVRFGYDMDIIPSNLTTYGDDTKALLKELQSQNERMFLLTFLVLNTGRTKQELENNVFQANNIAQKYNCNLVRLDFQQKQGLISSLPPVHDEIEIQRGMTTSSTAIFVPLTMQELFQSGKEALYYSLSALPNNLIMVDRKLLKNPNGLILGASGSGKPFAAECGITNAFLATDNDIIIPDLEAEYSALVQRFGGQVIKTMPTNEQYINPMDINMNYSDDDNPIALKADFILSLCELTADGREGPESVEKTAIDRCTHQIYNHRFEDPRPGKMPLLEDLYTALLKQEKPEVKNVAIALEVYVIGFLNVSNHRTNVNINNRLVCYNIEGLGKQLKEIGMLAVQDVHFVFR